MEVLTFFAVCTEDPVVKYSFPFYFFLFLLREYNGILSKLFSWRENKMNVRYSCESERNECFFLSNPSGKVKCISMSFDYIHKETGFAL